MNNNGFSVGGLTIRQNPTTSEWFVRYRFNGKRYETGLTTTKRASAVAKANKVFQDLENGINPFDPHITLTDFALMEDGPFRTRYKRWGEDISRGQWPLVVKICDEWGSKYIDQITREVVETYLGNIVVSGRAPSTANRYLASLRTLMKQAVEWGYLETNPTDKIRPLKEPEAEKTFLTLPQFNTVQRLIDEKWRSLVLMLVSTGKKIGDTKKLKWSDINLTKKTINFSSGKGVKTTYTVSKELLQSLQNESDKTGSFIKSQGGWPLTHPLRRVQKLAWVSVRINKVSGPLKQKHIDELKNEYNEKFGEKLSTTIINYATIHGSKQDVELPHIHPNILHNTFLEWSKADHQIDKDELASQSTVDWMVKMSKKIKAPEKKQGERNLNFN